MAGLTRRTPGRASTTSIVVLLAFSFAFIAPGLWLVAQGHLGTQVDAKVIHCAVQSSGRSEQELCSARWTIDGRTVEGDIEGATSSEVGTTVTATIHGDTAYTTSLDLPLILVGLGLCFVVLTFFWARGRNREAAAAAATAEPGPTT